MGTTTTKKRNIIVLGMKQEGIISNLDIMERNIVYNLYK